MTTSNEPELPTLRPRLLLVDDQPINIQILYQLFQDDFEIFMATDGQQALGVCERESPDLILLDVVMPEMDGLEVCLRLKASPATRAIPVIFVTGQNAPDEEAAGLEVGAVDFISKPISPPVVKARVKTQLKLKALTDQLRGLAFVDGLTGIANRRRFDEACDQEWNFGRRHDVPLGLILIDVDHFKAYNDHYGHQAGDATLQAVATTLKSSLRRPRELATRFGGEEFACLLPGIALSEALQIASSLCRAVQEAGLPHELSTTASVVTVSAGVASEIPGPERSPADLLKQADACLYQAKSQGRNRAIAALPDGA